MIAKMINKRDCSVITNRAYENKFEEKRRNRHRVPSIFARLILGGVFIYAGFDKILHPAAFSEAIYNYQILPDVFINLTAIILPWLELFLGVILIVGFWVPGAVVISNVLLITFLGAMLFNLARGMDISCGCFSTSSAGSTINTWTVLRDGFFLAISLYLFFATFGSMPWKNYKPGRRWRQRA